MDLSLTDGDLPRGAWDCHTHVFGSFEAYPLRRPGPGTPNPEAAIEALMAMHAELGIAHGCLVQPVEYGWDHSYLLHALAAAEGAYVGVAMADPDLGRAAMARMAAGGVGALRFMFFDQAKLTPTRDALMGGVAAARDLGWRLRVLGSPANHPELFAVLEAVEDVPILLEHMAMSGPGPVGEGLARMLAKPNVWLMLSSGHRRSREPPPWRDMAETCAALYALAPRRCVWGSDWPYLGAGPRIDERDALALLASYLPDEAAWRAVMAGNPAALNA